LFLCSLSRNRLAPVGQIEPKVGQIKGYMCRNQVQFVANATVDVSEVPVSDMSVREIVSKISLSGGQGFVHCQCRKYLGRKDRRTEVNSIPLSLRGAGV
jgi:hypothetical protein